MDINNIREATRTIKKIEVIYARAPTLLSKEEEEEKPKKSEEEVLFLLKRQIRFSDIKNIKEIIRTLKQA